MNTRREKKTEEVRVAISGDLNRFLDLLVERGLFTSKAEFARFAIIEYLKKLPPSLLPSIQLRAPVAAPSQFFSPEGRIFQIEYAIEAANRGSPAIGASSNEGVVLVKVLPIPSLEKTPLFDPEAFSAVGYAKLDEHVAMVCCGIASDINIIRLRGVKEAQEKRKKNEKIDVLELVSNLSAYMHSFTQKIDCRPLGVQALIGGVDRSGPHLFSLDPSGSFLAVNGQAIGHNKEALNKRLSKNYKPDMSLDNTLTVIVEAFQTIPKITIKPKQVKIMWISAETGLIRELSLKEKEAFWKRLKK